MPTINTQPINPDSNTQTNKVGQITISSILPTDNNAEFIPQANSTCWTEFIVNNHYESDQHRYMLGISSPNGFQGASVAFCQLTAPTLLWVADWTACRAGLVPNIPDPSLTDPEWVLLDKHFEPGTVTVVQDGITPLYRISGTYIYGHKNPSAAVYDQINFGRQPWIEDFATRQIYKSDLMDSLIDL